MHSGGIITMPPWPRHWNREVSPTETAKVAAWNSWLEKHGYPPLARLAVLVRRGRGGCPCYRLPLAWPPDRDDAKDHRIAAEFLGWLGRAMLAGSR